MGEVCEAARRVESGAVTPEGRPDRQTPPQRFRSEFLEKNYLNK
jgi:hypothetical protein